MYLYQYQYTCMNILIHGNGVPEKSVWFVIALRREYLLLDFWRRRTETNTDIYRYWTNTDPDTDTIHGETIDMGIDSDFLLSIFHPLQLTLEHIWIEEN